MDKNYKRFLSPQGVFQNPQDYAERLAKWTQKYRFVFDTKSLQLMNISVGFITMKTSNSFLRNDGTLFQKIGEIRC